MNIPQVELWLDDRERSAVNKVLDSGWLSEGPQCEKFHDALLELMGAKYGVFAPNGTLALTMAILATNIGSPFEIIVPDCTFIASATAVMLAGAIPVFCDVKPDTFQIDVESAERFVTENTAGIMPVHLFGSCADMSSVRAFADRHHLAVIEDAAQAIGVHYKGRHAGTLSMLGCFSFFCDKTLTTAEGGFVITDDEYLYKVLQRIRCHGRLKSGSFLHPRIGWNFRITELQAALGNAQMSKLKDVIALKQQVYGWYRYELGDLSEVEFVTTEEGSERVPFRCALLVKQRNQLMEHLAQNGVEPRTFFYPLHKQDCFSIQFCPDDELFAQQRDDANFPNAIDGWERGLLLPCYPTLTRKEVAYIGATIREFYA